MQGLPDAFGSAKTSKGQDSKDPLLPGLLLKGEKQTEEDSLDPAAAPGEDADVPVQDVAVTVPMFPDDTFSQQTRAGREALPTVAGIIRGEGGQDQSDQVARLKYLLYVAAACIIVLMVVVVAIIVTTRPLFGGNAPAATEDGGPSGGGVCVPRPRC